MKIKKYLFYFLFFSIFIGIALMLMFSLGTQGIINIKNTWGNFQFTFIIFKYCIVLGFYIYFDQISEWVAHKKNNPKLKEVFISKKHMFFIPIIAMEILRYA
jgi:hypothetical protein